MSEELRMDAYYYGFDKTGVPEIDRLLSAVAWAGKAFHHTDAWLDEVEPRQGLTGKSPVDWIQNAANDAAAAWNRRGNELEPESVPIPTTVNMARMMLGLGYRYLQDNAPEHLAASTIPASEGELPPLLDTITRDDTEHDVEYVTADHAREYGKECARAAIASTRTASDTRTAAGEAECDAALHAAAAGQHDAGASADDEIVGHKTFSTEGGGFRHEPLRRGEADAIMAQVEAREHRRAELMPDEATARNIYFEAWLRLKELGWREAVYCPKDGTEFEVIEAGSTGVHRCIYSGEWPTGHWLVLADGDAYPSRPVLYRSIKEATSAPVPRVGGNTQSESFAVELGRESIAARTQADAGKDKAHGHREDYYLLANCRRMLATRARWSRTPNSSVAADLFATGSNSARQICFDAGIDPDGYKIARHPPATKPENT